MLSLSGQQTFLTTRTHPARLTSTEVINIRTKLVLIALSSVETETIRARTQRTLILTKVTVETCLTKTFGLQVTDCTETAIETFDSLAKLFVLIENKNDRKREKRSRSSQSNLIDVHNIVRRNPMGSGNDESIGRKLLDFDNDLDCQRRNHTNHWKQIVDRIYPNTNKRTIDLYRCTIVLWNCCRTDRRSDDKSLEQ